MAGRLVVHVSRSKGLPGGVARAGFNGLAELASYEGRLWAGLQADPHQMADYMQILHSQVSAVYANVNDFSALAAQDSAMEAHLEQMVFAHYAGIEDDLYAGNYDAAVAALSREGVTAVASIPATTDAGVEAMQALIQSDAAADLVRLSGVPEVLNAAQAAAAEKVAGWLSTAVDESANPLQDLAELRSAPMSLVGQFLNPAQILALFGYSQEEIDAFVQVAKENDVIITVRSRVQEALNFLNSAVGAALKPELMKMKTVNDIDVAFLGYPADSLGALVVRVPPTEQQVIDNLVGAGVGKDTADWNEVMDCYQKRLQEWQRPADGHTGMFNDMVQWNREGTVRTRWNWIDNEVHAASEYTTADFRLVDLSTNEPLPPGAEPRPGVDYAVEVRALHQGTGVPVGPWQRVVGDPDMVAITNMDGSGLTEAQHVAVLNDLRLTKVGVEHPELATWTRYDEEHPFYFAAKQKQLEESGDFIQICPDGSVRAVRYNPELTNIWQLGRNAYDYNIAFEGGCQEPLSSISAAGATVP